MKLFNEHDGANYQARATLAVLSARNIESSYNQVLQRYEAQPAVARWENCREQGYVIRLSGQRYVGQINIAFFEHRNSDELCAIVWEQITINSPTIDTMDAKGSIYKNKFDPGKYDEMADFIMGELSAFWDKSGIA